MLLGRRHIQIVGIIVSIQAGLLWTPGLIHATSTAAAMAGRACHFLWQSQGDDGGWHSAVHGLLRGGQAWTPFVTFALLEMPEGVCIHPPEQVAQALQFIRTHVNADGALGFADPDVLEYPNYATAYALRVLLHTAVPGDGALRTAMQRYLVQQQFTEQRGVTSAHVAYGAWGFGELGLPPGSTGHVDLSHTRRVLQALRAAGHDEAGTYAKAMHFLRVVQKHPTAVAVQPAAATRYDGGFYFSPVVLSANKGGQEQERGWRSYATATCDGVLALLAAGATPTDEPVQAAIRWLHEHPRLDAPQGIPEDNPGQWHKVMFYYHLAARAEVYQRLAWPGNWRQHMVALLANRQRQDGSFINPAGALNKEDDPLLATALALGVLGNVLR